MTTLKTVIGVLRRGVQNIKAKNRLVVPVVDAVSEVLNPEEGTWVYLTGESSRPEGMWRYTDDGWRSGAQTNRISVGRGVEALSNNSNRRIANFIVPAGESLVIWAAQISASAGAEDGALLQVQDVDDAEIDYELNAGDDGIEIHQGNPLFETAGEGHEYRVRIRNETGGSTGFTAFMSVSTESLPQ